MFMLLLVAVVQLLLATGDHDAHYSLGLPPRYHAHYLGCRSGSVLPPVGSRARRQETLRCEQVAS